MLWAVYTHIDSSQGNEVLEVCGWLYCEIEYSTYEEKYHDEVHYYTVQAKIIYRIIYTDKS